MIQATSALTRDRAAIVPRYRGELCGCFYCLETFAPADIEDWIEEQAGEKTALCPRCGIDSVIGSASGYPITNAFLQRMHAHWFEQTNKKND